MLPLRFLISTFIHLFLFFFFSWPNCPAHDEKEIIILLDDNDGACYYYIFEWYRVYGRYYLFFYTFEMFYFRYFVPGVRFFFFFWIDTLSTLNCLHVIVLLIFTDIFRIEFMFLIFVLLLLFIAQWDIYGSYFQTSFHLGFREHVKVLAMKSYMFEFHFVSNIQILFHLFNLFSTFFVTEVFLRKPRYFIRTVNGSIFCIFVP